jgi:DNA-binding transcriptional LysR family regulator
VINAPAPSYCEPASPLLLLSRTSISPVFDPTLLTSFMAVAKAASFSEAGRRLNLREVLRDFTRIHRAVDFELRVDLSGTLFQALEFAELDLVLAKRRPGEDRGRLVRRERLIWIAADPALADPARPLPLILYPPPSISRAIALEALERAGRSWRIVCTSGSLSGLDATALAGLGICVRSDGFVPAGLSELPRSSGLPELGHIEFVVAGNGALRGPANALAAAILDNADRL